MSEIVTLEEGGTVNVHARIKDMCREARNNRGLSNQDIANLICERFGLDDFSINTVNNFFSDRSKATTVYTTGCICAALDISLDAVFGIKSNLSSEEEQRLVKELEEIKAELRNQDQRNSFLSTLISEKDSRLEQAHSALVHYRNESAHNSHKVPSWVFTLTVVLLFIVIVLFLIYILYFDLNNPQYGLFRNPRI